MLARYCLKMPERCLLRGSAMIPSTRNLRGVCTQPLERSRPRSVVYVLPRIEYDLTVEDTGTIPKQSLVSMSQPEGRCDRTRHTRCCSWSKLAVKVKSRLPCKLNFRGLFQSVSIPQAWRCSAQCAKGLRLSTVLAFHCHD